jgi:hypothetical protein
LIAELPVCFTDAMPSYAVLYRRARGL